MSVYTGTMFASRLKKFKIIANIEYLTNLKEISVLNSLEITSFKWNNAVKFLVGFYVSVSGSRCYFSMFITYLVLKISK
jgi:hypothetical protein